MTKDRLAAALRRAGLLLAGGGLLLLRGQAARGCAEGVRLCTQVLLPTLFPFFVVTALLTGELGAPSRGTRWLLRRLGLPECGGAALLLGTAGGFPVGAGCAAQLCAQGRCSPRQARRLAMVCHCPGPAFVIGALGGGMLGSLRDGVLLYSSQLLAGVLLALLLPEKSLAEQEKSFTEKFPPSEPFSQRLLAAVSESFSKFLNVCAFVLLCSVLAGAVSPLLPPGPGGALVRAGLELTGGAAALVSCGLKRAILLPLLALSCGWGGLSVQLQALRLLHQGGVDCRGWLAVALLRGGLAAGVAAALLWCGSGVCRFFS